MDGPNEIEGKAQEIKRNFNVVYNMTAKCVSTNDGWQEYSYLEIGKVYNIIGIGVMRSSAHIMLEEFGDKSFNALLFDIFENDRICDYLHQKRFTAPYLREMSIQRSYDSNTLDMKESILQHIQDIEGKYNVKILLAAEAGSRAWGFESQNSDWDLRFIYVHKLDWYLSIEERRNVIEHVYEDNVDAVGWELRKALQLLKKGNATMLEWFHSPYIYYADREFYQRIVAYETQNRDYSKLTYHYNHLYNKQNERFLQREDQPIKKFLYYLRGVLACQWIDEHHTLPPVNFNELMHYTIKQHKDLYHNVCQLVHKKSRGLECDLTAVDPLLKTWAQGRAEYYNQRFYDYQPRKYTNPLDQQLDKLMFDMVKKYG